MPIKCRTHDKIYANFSSNVAPSLLCNTNLSIPLETRMVLDIGSGTTKGKIALVEPQNGKIISTLKEATVPMAYQKCLKDSPDKATLSKECMSDGLASVMKIISILGIDDLSSIKNAAIATAWARNAKNIDEYMKILKEQGLNIHIISQQEEGEIGYKAAESHYMQCDAENRIAVVWDIGGGSYQLSARDDEGRIHVIHGGYGSTNFNEKASEFLGRKYSNPQEEMWDHKELSDIKEFAKQKVSDVIANDSKLKSMMNGKCVDLVAIGQFMNSGIKSFFGDHDTISTNNLSQILEQTAGKTVSEIPKMFPNRNENFAVYTQSDLLITEAIAKGLGKTEFVLLDAKSMDYVATDKQFWPDERLNPDHSFEDLICLNMDNPSSFVLVGSF